MSRFLGTHASRLDSTSADRLSEQLSTQRNVPVRGEEDYLPFAVGNAEYEHLALETSDPLRREVDDGDDLVAHQPFRLVVRSELGARPPRPDLRPEVHGQFDRGIP